MNIKKIIRLLIQQVIESLSSSLLRNNIAFICYNRTITDVIIKILSQNDCSIKFLPLKYEKFDWRYLDFDKEKFKLMVSGIKIWLLNNNINYLVVDKLTRDNLYPHAALEAANSIINLETIYLDHGDTGTYHPYIVYDRIMNYDYFYANDSSIRKHMEEEVKKYGSNIKIREWQRPMPKVKRKIDKKIIMYAPQFPTGDRFPQLFPEIIRYKHRIKILTELNILGDYKVIYKCFSKGNEIYDPTPDFIRDNLKYIKIENKNNFNKLLSKTSYFITDCVSTTIYDAIYLNIPSLCLRYYKAAPVRKDVLKQFGDSIFVYDDINEAVNKMYDFLLNSSEMPIIKHYKDKFPWEV